MWHSPGVSDDARAGGSLRELAATPRPLQVYLAVVAVAAVLLPVLVDLGRPTAGRPALLTGAVLVAISVLNVEISRWLTGGVSHSHQPHKALSAWAFAAALLLPTPWLLVVVPLTYAHARWRGLRLPLWKWIGSACYLVLAGMAAAAVRHVVLGEATNWMSGDGGRGLFGMLLAATAFLVTESLLFAGSAVLNHADDEVWLRRTLRSPSFYLTEAGVLLIAGLLAAVWTGGAWFVLFFVPIYALAQRAALHEPLRERAETAAELAATNVELERANQFRSDLIGMLGHEIGNPLTSVLGYAQVGSEALEAGDTTGARRSFEVVERNGAQIRRVIHDILTLATSERGRLTAHPQPCRLEPHLRAAAAAQPPGRQPLVECPPELTVLVQPSHLDQILANLLSNAAKYAGGATHVTARPTSAGEVEILVVDAGPGVPADFRAHLFERFRRDADTAHHVVGTGLGLFVTRELSRANGGEVCYRDGEPSGSVFTVTLPAVPRSSGPDGG